MYRLNKDNNGFHIIHILYMYWKRDNNIKINYKILKKAYKEVIFKIFNVLLCVPQLVKKNTFFS